MKRKELRDFNNAFGYPAPNKPTVNANYKLRSKLIIEELEEYNQACKDSDIIEIADAIGDMAYLVLGAAVEHGINLEPIFNEIHQSNMSKLDRDGKPIFRADGKVLKSDLFFKPNISKALAYSFLDDDGLVMNDDVELESNDLGVDEFIHTLIDVTASYFDITVNAMVSQSRKQPLTLARQIVTYICYKRYGGFSTFDDILTNIINRDRTTFIHARKQISNLIKFNKEIAKAVEDITMQTNKMIKTIV